MVVPPIGDVDRSSGRPGKRIAIKVSSQFDAPCRANMGRIVHADANPAGPWSKGAISSWSSAKPCATARSIGGPPRADYPR
jgi:hypothetical protein